MPPSSDKPSEGQKNPSTSVKAGNRYILSKRAQTALTLILDNIIEEALEEARRLAENSGKHRVELAEIEGALKQLCERYHALWSTEASPSAIAKAKSRRI